MINDWGNVINNMLFFLILSTWNEGLHLCIVPREIGATLENTLGI